MHSTLDSTIYRTAWDRYNDRDKVTAEFTGFELKISNCEMNTLHVPFLISKKFNAVLLIVNENFILNFDYRNRDDYKYKV